MVSAGGWLHDLKESTDSLKRHSYCLQIACNAPASALTTGPNPTDRLFECTVPHFLRLARSLLPNELLAYNQNAFSALSYAPKNTTGMIQASLAPPASPCVFPEIPSLKSIRLKKNNFSQHKQTSSGRFLLLNHLIDGTHRCRRS